jgi:hypothetical protein
LISLELSQFRVDQSMSLSSHEAAYPAKPG